MKIVEWILSIYVISAFVYSFWDKLNVYKALKNTMGPLHLFLIGTVDAVSYVILFTVPFVLISLIIKLIMIKAKNLKVEYVFNRRFKIQMLIAFLFSFAFSVLFYSDVLVVTKYSPQLIKLSFEVFLLLFVSIFFTLTSLYGVISGIDPVIKKSRK